MGDTKFRQTNRRTAQGPYRQETRERKAAEGAERNAAWKALNVSDKLASLAARRGESKRQVSRLTARQAA